MRTLKKTLCLVLCLAMMAGLCVFASADFKDQGKIENEEAVAVLTGIGVIQGDDKGNFNPEGTLTRAEATVIITKLLGAADIKASTDKFTDVKADFWGMPFIAYCVAEGVVAGMGDGTFAPNAKLTGYQWATLLLRAIGYKIEGTAGAAASTVAVCLPSFAVIYLISLFFDQFLRLSVVASAFHGIQVCVIYLILSAGLKMLKQLEHSVFNIVILTTVAAAMVGCSIAAVSFSSIFYILFSGAAGLLVYAVQQLRKGEKKP